MKVSVFEIAYYIQNRGDEETTGPILVQAPVRAAGEDETAAIQTLRHQVEDQLGAAMTVTHVSNVAQDVLIADPDTSEVDSLKENLAAQIEENAKLIEQLNQKPAPTPAQPA